MTLARLAAGSDAQNRHIREQVFIYTQRPIMLKLVPLKHMPDVFCEEL